MEPEHEIKKQLRSRRRFVAGTSALGTASFLTRPLGALAEPPPEITKLTLFQNPVTCLAPHYAAEELLRAEGFTDIRYVKWPSETKNWSPEVLLSGEVEISLLFIPSGIAHVDAGSPVVILGGSHIGCVELVGGHRVRSTRDLRGKTVSLPKLASDEQIFISMFASYVGVNSKDINWVVNPDYGQYEQLLSEGKIDAFMTGPPHSLLMRERKVGHVLVNMTTERPWSQYFCCVIASTREFVRKHPVATKRALRAMLKAADVCAAEPRRVARILADKGLSSYEQGLQMLEEIPYGTWRNFDAEDSLRFFTLRMRDVGAVKSTPQRIIAEGTDWSFFNQLKKELKA